MNLPGGKHMMALVILLGAQSALLYRGVPTERIPARQPLSLFPESLDAWRMSREFPVEQAVQEVLKADDTLSRMYLNGGAGAEVSLFIAYFQSQRTGQTPHSPRHCLPGSGFEPASSGSQVIAVPGRTRPIRVNRYVVTRGSERNVVLYWYQSRDRVVASEYMAKIWLVLDSVRYRRSDTALVRVVIPVRHSDDDAAGRIGADFIRCIFPRLSDFLPT